MNSKKESSLKIKKVSDKEEKLRAKNVELRKECKYLRRRTKELAVKLRLFCGSSYQSISKILAIVNECFTIGLPKVPCPNTVQNWVSKMGYYTLQTPPTQLKGKAMSLIIDESIRLGKEKLLLVLGVKWKKLQTGALRYQDVVVLYMKGSTSWNSKKIKEALEQVKQRYGMEVKNILSDEDSTLKAASRLFGVTHLADMAHAMATCLRKTFNKSVDYQSFISLVGTYSYKIVNQFSLVKWAEKMLLFFNKLNDKEQIFFKELPNHFSIIMSLRVCLLLTQQIGAIFRNFGLSASSLAIIRQLLHQRTYKDKYVNIFIQHVENYLSDYELFIEASPDDCVHVSSEIIESIFGKYKAKASYCNLVGLTNLNLELPTYCLDKSQVEGYLIHALQSVFMTDLKTWKEKHSSDNQVVKRTNFFKFGT